MVFCNLQFSFVLIAFSALLPLNVKGQTTSSWTEYNGSYTESAVGGVANSANSILLNLRNAGGQPLNPPIHYGDLITAEMTLINDNYAAILPIQCEFSSGPASLPTSKIFFIVASCPNRDIIDLFDYIIKVERTSTSMTVVFRAFVFGSSEGGQLFMTCNFRACPQRRLCAPPSDCWGSSDFFDFLRSEEDSLGVRPNTQFSFQMSVPEIKEASTTNGISVHNGTLCMTEAIAYLTFSTLIVVTVLFLCSIFIIAFLAIGYFKSSKLARRRQRGHSERSVVERVYVQPSSSRDDLEPVFLPTLLSMNPNGQVPAENRKTYGRDIADPAIYSIIVPQMWADRANALAQKQTHQAGRRLSLDENRYLSRPEIENWSLGNANHRRRFT